MEEQREFITKIDKFNSKLKDLYSEIIYLDKPDIYDFIGREIGDIVDLEKIPEDRLKEYEKSGGILGVDGSVNKKGGSYPHYVEMYKAVCKSTKSRESIVLTDLSSPLMEYVEEEVSESEREISAMNHRNKALASIEMEAAIMGAKKFKPYAILLDGSLLRFNIYSKSLFNELREICQNQGILLIGVIEEIKTQIIGKPLKESLNIKNTVSYDREILFGKLKVGEMIIVRDEMNTKRTWTKKNTVETIDVSSGFLRTSLSPNAIGIDIIGSQKDRILEMANLVYTLTPSNSRGIPLWLDIVDREAKISNEMIDNYLENYLDRDIYERFFVTIRNKRT